MTAVIQGVQLLLSAQLETAKTLTTRACVMCVSMRERMTPAHGSVCVEVGHWGSVTAVREEDAPVHCIPS